MTKIQNFFNIPYIKLIFNLFIITGLFLNIFYFFDYWYSQRLLTRDQDTLSALTQFNSELKNEQTYFSSEVYKEKYAKELNFKNRGEKIIDTSVIEYLDSSEKINYTPNTSKKYISNTEKWIVCLFDYKTAPETKTSVDLGCK